MTASTQTRVVAGRVRLAGNGGAGFFDNERDQRQRGDTIVDLLRVGSFLEQ
jgi:hypothetical protein